MADLQPSGPVWNGQYVKGKDQSRVPRMAFPSSQPTAFDSPSILDQDRQEATRRAFQSGMYNCNGDHCTYNGGSQ